RTCLGLAWSSDLLGWLLGGRFVRRKGFCPEPVELGAKRIHAVRVELVDATGADGAVDHQPGLLQHLEMLRDGRPADRQPVRELADRLRTLGQTLEDLASRRVPKC